MNQESAQSLETQLADAKAALSQWEERDLIREDGGMVQDRRHEERGEQLRRQVVRLSRM
ncbi:hypothetical protein KWG64_18465 [Rahnella sp. PD12R]|uniref:hypothetical protein n=1 Tax=Rahnella sp. PD12R TaxID=2855688 RepID=UPI001C45E7A7|nr:hypothetical protein [Rahnella sp. PD12R]MBV6819931.1 hypothetical protein [Rahnella sp. PD12R]